MHVKKCPKISLVFAFVAVLVSFSVLRASAVNNIRTCVPVCWPPSPLPWPPSPSLPSSTQRCLSPVLSSSPSTLRLLRILPKLPGRAATGRAAPTARRVPSWTRRVALAVRTGRASSTDCGSRSHPCGSLAVLFSCFVFAAPLALWASPCPRLPVLPVLLSYSPASCGPALLLSCLFVFVSRPALLRSCLFVFASSPALLLSCFVLSCSPTRACLFVFASRPCPVLLPPVLLSCSPASSCPADLSCVVPSCSPTLLPRPVLPAPSCPASSCPALMLSCLVLSC